MQGVTLCQHIHLLYFRGEASAAVRALLHGLVYVQRLTLRGPYVQKVSTVALNEFELVSPDQQAGLAPSVATALPADWAVSLVGREGLTAARELVVAYDVLFRPGELLACSVCNILLPRAAAVSKMAFLVDTIAPSGDTAGAASKSRTKAGSYDDTKLSDVCPANFFWQRFGVGGVDRTSHFTSGQSAVLCSVPPSFGGNHARGFSCAWFHGIPLDPSHLLARWDQFGFGKSAP
jgi:hypothetical protein